MAAAGRHRLLWLSCSADQLPGTGSLPASMSSDSGGARFDGAARRTAPRGHGSRSWLTTSFPNPASFILGHASALPSNTQGGSRMRESRTYGSVRGARSNGRPYRDHRRPARPHRRPSGAADCRTPALELAARPHYPRCRLSRPARRALTPRSLRGRQLASSHREERVGSKSLGREARETHKV